MIEPVNERRCWRCRVMFVGVGPYCGPCRKARDRWRAAEAEIRRIEQARGPDLRPLRIVDLRRRAAGGVRR